MSLHESGDFKMFLKRILQHHFNSEK